MVGDSYNYDYEAGKKASVNSFLLEMVTVNNGIVAQPSRQQKMSGVILLV